MDPLAQIIGQSPGMRAIQAQVGRLLSLAASARRIPPVLLRGETGTGKGLLARSIHAASPRSTRPFVSVNCAAIPDTLLEAELFGVERGAFTDARQAKPGLFQQAHSGTLFLDEVGLLPASLQAKLLTAVDERAVRRLGGIRTEPTDCWIMAATSADLEVARRQGCFREDLYHRLSGFTICLPPLRERGDDILRLAEAILDRVCEDYGLPPRTLAESARCALARYRWPGNVRELTNVLARAVVLAERPLIEADALALPDHDDHREPGAAVARVDVQSAGLRGSLDDLERERLVEALARTHWNVALAAEILGVPRNTLRYRIERHRLTRPNEPVRRRSTTLRPPRERSARPNAEPTVRWEMRTATWLRVIVASPSVSEVSRLLALFAGKVTGFGGQILQQTPGSLDAIFGLEASEDAPVRAANVALAIQRAAGRAGAEASVVRIALHASRCAVGLGQTPPSPAHDAVREADETLRRLLAGTDGGDVALSSAVAPLLGRRFSVRPVDPGG